MVINDSIKYNDKAQHNFYRSSSIVDETISVTKQLLFLNQEIYLLTSFYALT